MFYTEQQSSDYIPDLPVTPQVQTQHTCSKERFIWIDIVQMETLHLKWCIFKTHRSE